MNVDQSLDTVNPRQMKTKHQISARRWGRFFITLEMSIISMIYYTYVVVVWGPRAAEDRWSAAMLIIYNVLVFMVLWSFWQASLTNPGNVPMKWGYDHNGSDVVKRRFCLTCQCFKPDRCHHCSACNVCVLNMDHHCLWINNCIGFWNRKKFLLLIIYAEIITVFMEVTLARDVFEAMRWGFSDQFLSKFDNTFKQHMLVIITYFFNTIIMGLMTFFLRFHWRLAVENKTTIENLEYCDQRFWSKYDVGQKKNLAQIFGSNPLLYPLPITGEPHGDGLRFPIRQNWIQAVSSHDVEQSRRRQQFLVANKKSHQSSARSDIMEADLLAKNSYPPQKRGNSLVNKQTRSMKSNKHSDCNSTEFSQGKRKLESPDQPHQEIDDYNMNSQRPPRHMRGLSIDREQNNATTYANSGSSQGRNTHLKTAIHQQKIPESQKKYNLHNIQQSNTGSFNSLSNEQNNNQSIDQVQLNSFGRNGQKTTNIVADSKPSPQKVSGQTGQNAGMISQEINLANQRRRKQLFN